MIAVKLNGRLGNQLFQYAFIYATAKKLNTRFYIDKSIEDFLPAKFFNIKKDIFYPIDKFIFSIKGYKNLFNIHSKKRYYKTLQQVLFRNNIISVQNDLPVLQQSNQIKDGHIYEGYFQSEKYFEDYKQDIREQLVIKKKYVKAFSEALKDIPFSVKRVVVHVRRTDYVDLQMSLPLSYYKDAIAAINDANALYIFVSDAPDYIEQEFGYLKNRYVSKNDEITDLQFLMNADVCILSNSSFSWWGAWLNNKTDKVIYAPKNWLGFGTDIEYPLGIAQNQNINWINS